ncbi:MAG: LTA synthase family protein [Deltaproteobacteria bacterium]|nr:LTA synthase family protein [Deltaproteobacteria bacterium]
MSQPLPPEQRPSRLPLVLSALVLAPVVFRVVLIADRTPGIALADLRGLVSDLAVALVALALVLLAGRLSRGLAVLLVGFWSVSHYANLEVVRELGSLASLLDVEFLADGTFLAGSVAALAMPLLLAVVSIASLVLAWLGLGSASTKQIGLAAAAGFLLAVGQLLWPWTDEVAFWRQTDFLQQNVAYVLGAGLHADDSGLHFADPPAAMLDRLPELRGDLGGRSILPSEGRGRNVLLIVIESLSGGHVKDLAAEHGVATPHALEALGRLAGSSISYSTFFANQRKTNRGMYAILCGELPNLLPGTPKMSQHAVGGWRRCLPEVLSSAGYATAYLQAAPLAFMMKDQFMPRAGFERVLGYDDFDRGYIRTHWGVDDRSLYEQSLPVIEELRRGERPWFATLLTVTTHHPYTVPESFTLHEGFPHAQALAYADRALGEFLGELGRRGVLDDTLVLVTSDESMGQASELGSDGISKMLAESWGILIARTPNRQVRRVHESFAQADLAVSILDYLGLSELGPHFFGRSVFREYSEGRYVFFANTNHYMVGAVDPFGRVLLCLPAGDLGCRKYNVPRGQVFGPQRKRIPWVEAEDDIVGELAARSVQTRPSGPRRRDYELVSKREIVVAPASYMILHGGQYVDLGPGEWMEVELELEAHGEGGYVEIDHYTTQTNSWAVKRDPKGLSSLVNKRVDLRDGQTLRWKYAIAPAEPMKGLQSRSMVRSRSKTPFKLIVKTARMRVRWAGDRPEEKVRVDFFEVVPTT